MSGNLKKKMGETVRNILYAANYLWEVINLPELDGSIVMLMRAAKTLCVVYDLKEMEIVRNFENVVISEYGERVAKKVEQEARELINEGFGEENR